MLRQEDGYVSGQQICDRLKVSRTAVWKMIEQLKEEGYRIDAVRSRGYRLEETPDLLGEAEIRSRLETTWAGQNLYYFPEVDSTNLMAKKLGEEGVPSGTLVAADRQTAGRGRRGRAWESPAEANIYMSLLLRPEILPDLAPMLTLVMAQSAAEAVSGITESFVQIKWPNDIVMNGKKICGILTEMSTEIDWINYVVIGVGMNVNQEEFPEELREKATSLFRETGRKISRAALITAVMKRFEENYKLFMKKKDVSAIRDAYNRILINRGQEVRVLDPNHEYSGYALGINDRGELLVRREDGGIEEVYAGEVSIRGIYGYV